MTDTTTKPDYLGHRQRLKERFLMSDGRGMPDYELLELLLTYSIPRRDVKPLAKKLIRRLGGFSQAINASKEELYAIPGVKENTYTLFRMIAAAIERCSWQYLRESEMPILLTPDALIDYCRAVIAFSDVEEIHIIFLNNQMQVIGKQLMQRGTINSVSIHPREIVKAALNNKASSIILVHNHPSGDVTPSMADISVTQSIKQACEPVGIRLADHIVISQSDVYSFGSNNLL